MYRHGHIFPFNINFKKNSNEYHKTQTTIKCQLHPILLRIFILLKEKTKI